MGTWLESLAAAGQAPAGGLWYFGDIDTPGFRIARMAAERAESLGLGPARPATALYGLCYAAGSPRPGKGIPSEVLSPWIVEWIGEPLGHQIVTLLEGRRKIVQETVGVELLATQGAARLLP